MKDITTTSFGIIIAYLIPGLIILFGLIYFSGYYEKMFNLDLLSDRYFRFLSDSQLYLFLILMLLSTCIGLLINILRFFFFQRWRCKDIELRNENFKNITDETKLNVFRTLADENFRYHQFYGNIFFAILFLLITWFIFSQIFIWKKIVISIIILLFDYVIYKGTIGAYKIYVERGNNIFGGN